MIEQHNTFAFWNGLPNKSQDLSKYLVFSFFHVTKCLCFRSYLWNSLTLSKNQWLIGYQISLIVIARQPKYHRFYALIITRIWIQYPAQIYISCLYLPVASCTVVSAQALAITITRQTNSILKKRCFLIHLVVSMLSL